MRGGKEGEKYENGEGRKMVGIEESNQRWREKEREGEGGRERGRGEGRDRGKEGGRGENGLRRDLPSLGETKDQLPLTPLHLFLPPLQLNALPTITFLPLQLPFPLPSPPLFQLTSPLSSPSSPHGVIPTLGLPASVYSQPRPPSHPSPSPYGAVREVM